jgi:hypothetical protein
MRHGRRGWAPTPSTDSSVRATDSSRTLPDHDEGREAVPGERDRPIELVAVPFS